MIKESSVGESKEKMAKWQPSRIVLHPELSLGPSLSFSAEEAHAHSSVFDGSPCKKRKISCDKPPILGGIELHLNDPLPFGWEQCLDLQSGRMYYLNRKTLRKSWVRPMGQKLDLELNMSTAQSSEEKTDSTTTLEDPEKTTNVCSMVAVICFKCHLLVMLCRSSPACPNCKFLHSLPPVSPQIPPLMIKPAKSMETLSLLH